MSHVRLIAIFSAAILLSLALPVAVQAQPPAQQPDAAQQPPAQLKPAPLLVTVGKSLILDSPLNITRISIADAGLVETVANNPKEIVINGKAPGETSMIVWQSNGKRLEYELTVKASGAAKEGK